jgi:hypothetical protein
MASKFQKNPFPVHQVAKMTFVRVSTRLDSIGEGKEIDLKFSELKKKVINGQLCFVYHSEDGDLILPICRTSTVIKLEKQDETQPL